VRLSGTIAVAKDRRRGGTDWEEDQGPGIIGYPWLNVSGANSSRRSAMPAAPGTAQLRDPRRVLRKPDGRRRRLPSKKSVLLRM